VSCLWLSDNSRFAAPESGGRAVGQPDHERAGERRQILWGGCLTDKRDIGNLNRDLPDRFAVSAPSTSSTPRPERYRLPPSSGSNPRHWPMVIELLRRGQNRRCETAGPTLDLVFPWPSTATAMSITRVDRGDHRQPSHAFGFQPAAMLRVGRGTGQVRPLREPRPEPPSEIPSDPYPRPEMRERLDALEGAIPALAPPPASRGSVLREGADAIAWSLDRLWNKHGNLR